MGSLHPNAGHLLTVSKPGSTHGFKPSSDELTKPTLFLLGCFAAGRFKQVLKDCGALLLIDLWRVGARQTLIELVFDREANLRPALGGWAPIKSEGLLDSLQKISRDLLCFFTLFIAQVGAKSGEQIEDCHPLMLLAPIRP